ncbi:MAG: hypothetical protein AAF847_02740 [Bacteroidota bacterium]
MGASQNVVLLIKGRIFVCISCGRIRKSTKEDFRMLQGFLRARSVKALTLLALKIPLAESFSPLKKTFCDILRCALKIQVYELNAVLPKQNQQLSVVNEENRNRMGRYQANFPKTSG